MKRILLLLAVAGLLLTACASAESQSTPEPDAHVCAPAGDTTTAEPQLTPTPEPITGDVKLDVANMTPDDPSATPIPVDPIDKPTDTPMPTPNYAYKTYASDSLNISFSIPYTWLLNPNTNQTTTLQFVEPKSEMMEPDGYQTRLTIEKVNTGLTQTADDARERLETTLSQMEGTFTSFTSYPIASRSIGDAKGSYCYYKAEYNDGTKTYLMRGRIIVVAYEKALYQVRITAPQNWYSYYEHVFRNVCNTLKFN